MQQQHQYFSSLCISSVSPKQKCFISSSIFLLSICSFDFWNNMIYLFSSWNILSASLKQERFDFNFHCVYYSAFSPLHTSLWPESVSRPWIKVTIHWGTWTWCHCQVTHIWHENRTGVTYYRWHPNTLLPFDYRAYCQIFSDERDKMIRDKNAWCWQDAAVMGIMMCDWQKFWGSCWNMRCKQLWKKAFNILISKNTNRSLSNLMLDSNFQFVSNEAQGLLSRNVWYHIPIIVKILDIPQAKLPK